MGTLLKQVLIVADDGERFQILVSIEDRIPNFLTSVYQVSMRRPRGLAASTLESEGRALMHLYAWALREGIDLEDRFRSGRFLDLNEIESLVRSTYLKYRVLVEQATHQAKKKSKTRIKSLESYRKKNQTKSFNQVKRTTVKVRIFRVRDYLDWLAKYFLRNNSPTSARYVSLEEARRGMYEALDARAPDIDTHETPFKEGLTHKEEALLREVITPAHPENPWQSAWVQFRNQVVIEVLRALGLRIGELLNLRISSINFQENTLSVDRNPDDPEDPRLREPNVKTRGRVLPMDSALSGMLYQYVLDVRSKVNAGKSHDFLIISKHGDPISRESITKIFSVLRVRIEGLPENLSPHILRHTWNDRFSEYADQKKLSESYEKKYRSYLMGWSETSGTAARYTKRHTREEAMRYARDMQSKIKVVKP